MTVDGDKARVEIEVAIRDMFSTTMKQMGRELDDMNKKAQELGQGASGAFYKFRRENDQLAESTKRSNASLTEMGGIFKLLTNSILGPVGIVAGFYEVSKSLGEFSKNQVQLKMFSNEIGFSTAQISIMQRTMANMGMSSEESLKVITNVGSKLRGMFELGLGSQLFRDLADMGEGKWAAQLLKVVQSGDFDAAVKMIIAKGQTGSDQFKSYFAGKTGIPESISEAWTKASKGIEA